MYLGTFQFLFVFYSSSCHQSFWHLGASATLEEVKLSSHNHLLARHRASCVYLISRKRALPEDIVMGVDLLAHPRVIQYSSVAHNSTADARWHTAVAVGQEQLLVRVWGQ